MDIQGHGEMLSFKIIHSPYFPLILRIPCLTFSQSFCAMEVASGQFYLGIQPVTLLDDQEPVAQEVPFGVSGA